jgi:hypothetical protein
MVTPVRELFHDLLDLEINTIIKAGMTGRKMPVVAHAIYDIFSEYDLYLCQQAGHLNPVWTRFRATADATAFRGSLREDKSRLLDADGQLIARLDPQAFLNVTESITSSNFDDLRERARRTEEMLRALIQYRFRSDDGTAVILKRIYRNSDQIKAILHPRETGTAGTADPRLGWFSRRRRHTLPAAIGDGITRANAGAMDLALTADEFLVIRKAWEVGTETILMQTVAQLDGDMVTRVQPDTLGAQSDGLRQVHRIAVEDAFEHWQFLVKTLEEITSGAAGFLRR